MLYKSDIEFLADNHPELRINHDKTRIDGIIDFTCSYDKKQGELLIEGINYDDLVLSGKFEISIKIPTEKNEFPVLYVNSIDEKEKIPDRHFNGYDKSACVCGTSDIDEFFTSDGLNFKKYMKGAVIPFLWAQVYYNQHKKWPWKELSHGISGVLESYYLDGSIISIERTIDFIKSKCPNYWKEIEKILNNKNYPKGHISCFCGSSEYIRRCHIEAWEGLKKLHADFQKFRKQK